MTYKEVTVKIKLQGWFPDIYEHNKPKGMKDDNYITAIVESWLMDRDEKNPIPKTVGRERQ